MRTVTRQSPTLVEVEIYDCAKHHWMQGGVTGDTLMKVLANLQPTRYTTRPRMEQAENATAFSWFGWIIRVHGDDGTTVADGPQAYRKLTFVGTHDPDWQDGHRGSADELYSLLRDEQRESQGRGTCLTGMADALRMQVINAIGDDLVPAAP